MNDASWSSFTGRPASCVIASFGCLRSKAASDISPRNAARMSSGSAVTPLAICSPPPTGRFVRRGNGSIDSMPLNAHVAAPRPNTRPKIVCQRFWPRYGMLVGEPALRYFFDGEYIQTPTMIPRMAAPVPMPDDQMTVLLHSGPCFRSGVKYSQCGIAPRYAPQRDPVVVYCSTSPVVAEMYTCWPSGNENL